MKGVPVGMRMRGKGKFAVVYTDRGEAPSRIFHALKYNASQDGVINVSSGPGAGGGIKVTVMPAGDGGGGDGDDDGLPGILRTYDEAEMRRRQQESVLSPRNWGPPATNCFLRGNWQPHLVAH